MKLCMNIIPLHTILTSKHFNFLPWIIPIKWKLLGWVLIIKPTWCTSFSNLFLQWNCTCFRQFLCPSSGVFHCTHSSGICHTGLLTACVQDQDRNAVPSWSCSQAVCKPVWHILLLYVQRKTPDDGHRNCPKHVEFYSKNKFEKLVHLVGLIIRIYHDARSPERRILGWDYCCYQHRVLKFGMVIYFWKICNSCWSNLFIKHQTT